MVYTPSLRAHVNSFKTQKTCDDQKLHGKTPTSHVSVRSHPKQQKNSFCSLNCSLCLQTPSPSAVWHRLSCGLATFTLDPVMASRSFVVVPCLPAASYLGDCWKRAPYGHIVRSDCEVRKRSARQSPAARALEIKWTDGKALQMGNSRRV